MYLKFTVMREDYLASPADRPICVLITKYGRKARLPETMYSIAPSFCARFTGREFLDGSFKTIFQEGKQFFHADSIGDFSALIRIWKRDLDTYISLCGNNEEAEDWRECIRVMEKRLAEMEAAAV